MVLLIRNSFMYLSVTQMFSSKSPSVGASADAYRENRRIMWACMYGYGSMYVCLYVWVWLRVCVLMVACMTCMYACMRAHGCVYMCVWLSVCVLACVHIAVCMCVCMWVWLQACVLVCWLAPVALCGTSASGTAWGCVPHGLTDEWRQAIFSNFWI